MIMISPFLKLSTIFSKKKNYFVNNQSVEQTSCQKVLIFSKTISLNLLDPREALVELDYIH